MLERLKTWLAQRYPCRFCDGTGYESNYRKLVNQFRTRGLLVLAVAIIVFRLWPTPVNPPLLRQTAPTPR